MRIFIYTHLVHGAPRIKFSPHLAWLHHKKEANQGKWEYDERSLLLGVAYFDDPWKFQLEDD